MTGHTPAQIIGELLARHPEAASLQGEASHRQALAVCSAALVGQLFTEAQAARLGYDELRHRLDSRRRHPVHFAVGLLLLAVLGTGLTMLDAFELGGTRSVPLAVAAAAVWVTVAWLAALASQARRWVSAAAVIGGAVFLGLLLVLLHGLDHHGRGGSVLGFLVGVFILVLVTGAAVLIAHMEPASLLVARWRWHRVRAAHEAAVRTERDDVAAAAVATEAWLGLVRTQAAASAGDDGQLVHETVALAASLLGSGRPQLLPPATHSS
jgi:hypothetical protein